MKTLVYWFEHLPQYMKLGISSLFTAINFVVASIVAAWLKSTVASGVVIWLSVAVAAIVATTIAFLFRNAFVLAQEHMHSETEQEKQLLVQAHYQCALLTINEMRNLRTDGVSVPAEEIVRNSLPSIFRIQLIVEAAFKAFETVFGRASLPDERIDFEVTFMTRSYIDGMITIPAAANRDGRDPRSMVLRSSKPDIYDGTETAKIYAADRPHMIIVDDTMSHNDYKQLYDGEKSRIRSSIITPVLSEKNELLGTLVVHCDRPGFFSRGKVKFWSDVVEVFTKRIALEKRRLDVLVAANNTTISCTVPMAKPF